MSLFEINSPNCQKLPQFPGPPIEPNTFEEIISRIEQPKPKGKGPEIFPLVIHDLLKREQIGIERYGESLKANNGRDSLRDAYEEALDLCLYLRQRIEEERRGE
jgi:hypothetical protein